MNRGLIKVCPYHNVTQAHRTLGRWQRPDSDAEKKDLALMDFAHGDYSWECPSRTIKVRLVCGAANALVEFKETSKCAHEGVFATPCQCHAGLVQQYQSELSSF